MRHSYVVRGVTDEEAMQRSLISRLRQDGGEGMLHRHSSSAVCPGDGCQLYKDGEEVE